MSKPYVVHSPETRTKVEALVGGLSLENGTQWDVSVEPRKAKRSLNQNALMWKWNTIIAAETGNSADDIHKALKTKFTTPREVLGELVWSTKNEDKAAFALYLERVEAFSASELGIMLPHPEDMHLEDR